MYTINLMTLTIYAAAAAASLSDEAAWHRTLGIYQYDESTVL